MLIFVIPLLDPGTRKTNNHRLSLTIMGAPKLSTNSLLLITRTCARCLPIGFLRTSEVTRCDFRGTLERRSTTRSMTGNGFEDGTRILFIGYPKATQAQSLSGSEFPCLQLGCWGVPITVSSRTLVFAAGRRLSMTFWRKWDSAQCAAAGVG